jgi:Arc/MetJ-type ribon-helix-helix transcriptional regulator
MSEVQRVNITLPKKLLQKSKILIEEGLYSNFSELVRESIKNEILLESNLIEKKKILDKWFKEEEGNWFDTSHLTQEEIIKRIRKTRNALWDKKYKEWFEGLS